MELTSNFKAGLESAYERQRNVCDCLSVEQILRRPIQMIDGRTVNNMAAVHRRVRRLYIRKTWNVKALITGLDWNDLVDWMVEHWADILKIIFAILPFLI